MKLFRLALAPCLAATALALAPAPALHADEQRSQASRQPPIGAENARKLDLNTADEKALASVSVIGPDLAQALVAARPFATIDDLERVQGVSAERLEEIRARVTVVPVASKNSTRQDSLGLPRADSTAPSRGTARTSRATTETGTRGVGAAKLDVNSADQAALAALPSVGPDLASALVAARPFRTIDDLARVQGVSAERLELLRQDLDVQPAGTKAKRTRKSESRSSAAPTGANAPTSATGGSNTNPSPSGAPNTNAAPDAGR